MYVAVRDGEYVADGVNVSDRVVEYVAENDGVLDGVMVSEGDALSDLVSETVALTDGDGD